MPETNPPSTTDRKPRLDSRDDPPLADPTSKASVAVPRRRPRVSLAPPEARPQRAALRLLCAAAGPVPIQQKETGSLASKGRADEVQPVLPVLLVLPGSLTESSSFAAWVSSTAVLMHSSGVEPR